MLRAALFLIVGWHSEVMAQEDAFDLCQVMPAGDAGEAICGINVDGLILTFSYAPVSDGAVLVVSQTLIDGRETRVSADISIKQEVQEPFLLNLNADGDAALMLPVARREDETAYAVWLRNADGFFTSVGTLNGQGPESFYARNGLIIHQKVITTEVRIETAYYFDQDGLYRLYALQIDSGAMECVMLLGRAVLNEQVILAECQARIEN